MVRFKNRWLLVSIDTPSPGTFTSQSLTRLLRTSLTLNFGDVASGTFGGSLVCRYYSSHTGTAIVRCAREGARIVWAAATMADEDENGAKIRIRVSHCGGTIKKVQLRAIELDKGKIAELERRKDHLLGKAKMAALVEEATREISAITHSTPVHASIPASI